ncbi:hypothetical protein P3T18_001224 [Paraburkholderia sp. GAS199]|uniref:hypothetical protein n=1 Tax=Paraburkholderia sp. GAS199 TaxID=3035126 RepID=UPI003D25217F
MDLSYVGKGIRDLNRFLKMLGQRWHEFPIEDQELPDITQWARETFTPEEYAALKRITRGMFPD